MTAEPASSDDARQGGSGRGNTHPDPLPPIPISQQTSPLNLDDFDVDLAVDGDQRSPSGNTITDAYSFRAENGRTYSGYDLGEYLLPNDGEEQDRLDLMHALSIALLGNRLYRAPVVSPAHVFDIGTGTGLWAVEFAEQHPESFVVGTDLSQIQPTGIPNCEFWVENSETQDWIFPYTLDYIHLRAMMTCFNDFQAVMHKSYDHMTPGGWIELYDGSWDFQCMDGTARGTALEQWANLLYLGGLRAGRDMRRARHYKQYLLNAGFVDVDEKVVWCPGSPWPADPRHKEIGWFMMENILGMIDGHAKFLESAGLSAVEIEALCSEAKRDARNLGIHWFVPVYTVYGRKPLSLGAPLGDSLSE